jgi:hypothetical protein
MWHLLPDRYEGGLGTLFFHEPDSDLRWHCVDQIIVSDHIQNHVDPPAILTKLGLQSLISDIGRPELSDHLPVQMTINIEKVMSCIASEKC